MKSSGQVGTGSGTSFASPITCGAMACLLQAVKANQSTYDIQGILDAVRQNASQASKPDTLLGWGIPNFSAALTAMGLEEGHPVPTWALQPFGSAYVLRRLRPTTSVTVHRYDGTGRLLETFDLEPGLGAIELRSYPGITLLHLVGEEEEVLKVPAF
jgi:subtilisin family serine protease